MCKFLKLAQAGLKGLFVSAFLFFLVSSASAELIPADRLTTWTPGVTVGVQGGIPNYPVYVNANGLDNTGATDVSAALQEMIRTCPVGKAVVLPAGVFRLDNFLYLHGNFALRGAGMNKTTLLIMGGGIRLDNDNSFYKLNTGQIVSGGLTKGSTNIVLTDSSPFKVYWMCLIGQFSSTDPYDNPLITTIGGTNGQSGYVYRTLVQVTGKTANGITIWPPLPGDMSARHARILPTQFISGWFGIEDLTIDVHTNATVQNGLTIGGAYDSWIKNVKIRHAKNYSVSLYDSMFMEIRDCWLDDLWHCPTCSNGSGLLLNTVNSSLFENNIILNSFPSIEINAGSCRNVFGYNFLLNTNGAIGIDSNHGPHNAYNLFEGNIANSHLSDGYFGSESDGTVFRNWYHGQYTTGDNSIGWAFSLKRFTRRYNLVGNILGSDAPYTMTYDGTSFGQPNMGNANFSGYAPKWKDWLIPQSPGVGYQELDTNVLATLVRRGNYNYFDKKIPAAEALGNDTLPNSLYRQSKPTWFGELAWPPFDPNNPSPSYVSNPAGYRFVNGVPPPGGGTALPGPFNLKISPN